MAVRVKARAAPGASFQIAPMIDVVFLLLIYFMVGSTIQKQEADIAFRLPGTVALDEPLDIPDEQIIEIRNDGQVVVNDHPCDTPAAARLTELTGMLARFRQAAEAGRSSAIVTIAPEEGVDHQRVVRVLDACAKAGIAHVNFALGEEP